MKFLSLTINGFDVKVAFDENSVHVYNAYPIKDDLKLRGYRWNAVEKVWYNDIDDVETELTVLKNDLKPDKNKQKKEDNSVQFENNSKIKDDIPASSSVAELRGRIQKLISESIAGNIWVRGVISSELKNYKWATYFDFRDEDELKDIFFSAELKSNILSSINYKLKNSGIAESLCKDLPVLLLVNVALSYKKNVNIRLSVIDILPEFTREKIKNQREITLDKLKLDGVLEKQKQLVLPLLIRRIGLITSEQGTSIEDILAGMGNYKNKYDIYFIDARMEGDKAVSSIIRGVEYFVKRKDLVDLIIIARGGGSDQSLSLFNDYNLCKKICGIEIPVLTAIGHEKDLSAIELCSFLTPSPSTPSGIGKYLYDKYVKTEQDLLYLFSNISNLSSMFLKEHLFTVQHKINSIAIINKRMIINNLNKITDLVKFVFLRLNSRNQLENQKIVLKIKKIEPERVYGTISEKRDYVFKRLRSVFVSGKRVFKNSDNNLNHINNIINASNPENILKKGFTLTFNENGRVITSKANFIDNKAVLRFYDGDIKINKVEDENG